jgi:hypothetical protein
MDMKKILHWGAILALVGGALLLRWPALPREIWNLDEAHTCVLAEHVLHGEVLYRDVVDTRGPLVVYILAGVMAIAGDWNMHAQHVTLALMLGLTAVLLWRIASRLGANGPGAWAAVAFSLLNLIFLDEVDVFTANTEWFVIFFSALAFWLLTVAWRGLRPWPAILAGMSFGCTYLAKQPGLFDFLTALVWVALFLAFEPVNRRERVRVAGCLALGFLFVAGGAPLYFAAHGAFKDFQFYVWTYSTRYYLPEVPAHARLLSLRQAFVLGWHNAPSFCIWGGLAAVSMLWGLGRSLRRKLAGQEIPLLALGWTASGVLASGLSGREYGHYSIQVLPGLSLLCGWIFHAAWQRANGPKPTWRLFLLRALICLTLAVGSAQIARRLTSLDMISGTGAERIVGQLVRANTGPTDRIFTWGYFPEICYHARRLSSTRFVFSIFLTGMIPWTNLAFDKDTAYAIIPGAWDQFWQDIARHPPTVIVDTGINRGHVKYPIARQARLWRYIQEHYVEIAADVTHAQGFKIYRRTAMPLTGTVSNSVDQSLALHESAKGSVHTGVFHVRLPEGLSAAEILVDGRSSGSVSLVSGHSRQLTFTHDPRFHGQQPIVVVRARRLDGTLVVGPTTQISGGAIHTSPAITFGARRIPAAEATAFNGIKWRPDANVFSTHAPGRLVFDCPPTLRSVSFSFGIFEGAYAPNQIEPTNGVELQVSYQPDGQSAERLLTRSLKPLSVEEDRGPQQMMVHLPGVKPGRLVIVISPGEDSIVSSDWSYISELTGYGLPFAVKFKDLDRPIEQFTAPLGLTMATVSSENVLFAHAPSAIEYLLEPDMDSISGGFGMLDESWNGPNGHTAGIEFIVEQVTNDGKLSELWRRKLNPTENTSDRGMQSFAFKLANPVQGRLRFRTAPALPPNNSFGYSYWAKLVAKPAD